MPFNTSSDDLYDLKNLQAIVVDSKHACARDHDGLTSIPPTLQEFAERFRHDLASIGIEIVVLSGRAAAVNTLFLTIDGDKAQFLNAAGQETSEGYIFSVSSNGIVISGASSLGAWWGTRSILQQAVLNDRKLKHGSGVDAPGWSERGMMVRWLNPVVERSLNALAGCGATLLPGRLPRRDVFLSVILQAKRLPSAFERPRLGPGEAWIS